MKSCAFISKTDLNLFCMKFSITFVQLYCLQKRQFGLINKGQHIFETFSREAIEKYEVIYIRLYESNKKIVQQSQFTYVGTKAILQNICKALKTSYTMGNSNSFSRKVFGCPILSICTKSMKLKKDEKVLSRSKFDYYPVFADGLFVERFVLESYGKA